MIGLLFGSPVTKGLALASLLLASTTALSTYLYLGTRDDLSALKTQYNAIQKGLEECSEGRERIRLSAEQDSKIVAENVIKISSLTQQTDNLKTQLNKIPNKVCKQPTTGVVDEIKYVDIDAPFSDEYKRVFEQLGRKN